MEGRTGKRSLNEIHRVRRATAHSNDFVGRSASPFSEFDKVSVRSARRLAGAMVSVGRNERRAHADSSVDD